MATVIVPCALNIDFGELSGSPTENITSDDKNPGTVTRTVYCLTIHKIQLIREFLGWTGFVGGNTIIHKPHEHLVHSGYLTAQSVATAPKGRIRGIVVDKRFGSHPLTWFVVTYVKPKLTKEAYNGLVSWTETFAVASEFTTLPHENLYWGVGESKVQIPASAAPSYIIPMAEWTVHISSTRMIPVTVEHVGHINALEEESPSGWVFAPRTLLFTGMDMTDHSGTRDEDGTWHPTFDLTFKFLWRPREWNIFPRPSAGGADVSWEKISDGTTEKLFYPEIDFTGFLFPENE